MSGGGVSFIFQLHVAVGLGPLRLLAVQPAGPRLEHPGRLPAPQPDPLPQSAAARSRGPWPSIRVPAEATVNGKEEHLTSDQRGSGRQLALATLAFAVCFSAWGMLAPMAPEPPGRARPLEHRDVDHDRDPGRPRLAAADPARPADRPVRRPPRLHRRCSSTRRAPRCWSASPPATRRCSAPASCSAPPAPPSRSASRSSPSGTRRSARASRSASTASATSAPRSPPSRCRRSATPPARRSPGSSLPP